MSGSKVREDFQRFGGQATGLNITERLSAGMFQARIFLTRDRMTQRVSSPEQISSGLSAGCSSSSWAPQVLCTVQTLPGDSHTFNIE